MTEFDDDLSRLFAEAREHPASEDFLEKMTVRISRARRRRAAGRTIAAAAAVGFAVASTPYIAAGSLTITAHLLPALGNALSSPVAWLCSLAIAGWGMRRARHG